MRMLANSMWIHLWSLKPRFLWYVMEGGRYGRRMQLPKDRVVYRGLGDLGLPKEFLEEDRFGVRGGVELGMMSTTQDQRVATQYAGTKMPTVFKIGVGAVDRGAPIKFLSQYPGENEILFPPRSYLEVTSETRMEAGADGKTTRVVSLSVNANQACGTIALPASLPAWPEASPACKHAAGRHAEAACGRTPGPSAETHQIARPATSGSRPWLSAVRRSTATSQFELKCGPSWGQRF